MVEAQLLPKEMLPNEVTFRPLLMEYDENKRNKATEDLFRNDAIDKVFLI